MKVEDVLEDNLNLEEEKERDAMRMLRIISKRTLLLDVLHRLEEGI